MPDGMPFMKQKGWAATFVEQAANKADSKTLFGLLVELHKADVAVGDVIQSLLGPDDPAGDVVDHLRRHWFGETKAAGAWAPQADFDPGNPATTGFWINYYGDVEGIVRMAMIRVIERLLDLDPVDHPQAGAAIVDEAGAKTIYGITAVPDGASAKRLEIWWLCPQPRFEAAVEVDADVVRLEFLTPAPEGGVLGTGYRKTDVGPFTANTGMGGPVPQKIDEVFKVVGKGGKPSAGEDSTDPLEKLEQAEVRESWLIGQDCIEPKNAFTWFKIPNTPFVIPDPFTYFVGKGDPATIDVAVAYGGRS